MKTFIIVCIAACALGAAGWYVTHQKQPHPGAPEPQAPLLAGTEQPPGSSGPPAAQPRTASHIPTSAPVTPELAASVPSASSAPAPKSQPPVFSQAVDTLVSTQAAYDQKQWAWKQLTDSGKLDFAISDLEQKMASHPDVAQYPATLGQAYLHKAGSISDLREQGILGMKADQSFEAALNLDPSNWEARFWKATAMSYWPPELNKGREVLTEFTELVKQQETMTPQPQFAQTYVLLGEQYQKQGYADHARQVWQRGASLFPNDTKLREKIQK